jgi:hypothetical protein
VTWLYNDGNLHFIYVDKVDAARPFVESIAVNDRLSLSVQFSEPMSASNGGFEPDGSVTSIANWQLTHDGRDVTNVVQSISQAVDPKTSRAKVSIIFNRELAPGEYVLIAKGAITDLSYRHLDGNSDGVGGDDYVERFTIVPPPLPSSPLVDVLTSSVPGPISSSFAVSPLDRSFVVVWQGPGQTAGETDVYARRFDEHGMAISSVVTANTFLPGNQTQPSVAMDDAGNYVVIWDTTIPLATGHVVYGRRFKADGTPLDADQFPVDTVPHAAATSPSVTMDSDGDFIVAWQGDLGGDTSEIFARRFTGATGSSLIRVNSQPAGVQQSPSSATDKDGNFIVVWNSVNGEANDVIARWFDAATLGSNEFRVNTTTAGAQDSPRVAMNRSGEFAVTWRGDGIDGSDVFAQRFDRMQRPISGEFVVSTSRTGQQAVPDLSLDRDGNIAFVWSDSSTSDGFNLRWFDKWGNLLADESRIDDTAHALNRPARVSSSPDGEIFVAYSIEAGPSSEPIYVQHYTLKPPTVLSARIGTDNKSFIVAYSQEMATSGVGDVLSPANWALRLPDGRYLAQAAIPDDPRATPEQFGSIGFGFNSTTKQWEATIPLNFTLLPGTYGLIARSTQQDAAGRRLDGDASGVIAEDHRIDLIRGGAGDFNSDASVDAADLSQWKQGFGTSGSSADANGDNLIDGADFLSWQRRAHSSAVAAAVETPVASDAAEALKVQPSSEPVGVESQAPVESSVLAGIAQIYDNQSATKKPNSSTEGEAIDLLLSSGSENPDVKVDAGRQVSRLEESSSYPEIDEDNEFLDADSDFDAYLEELDAVFALAW